MLNLISLSSTPDVLAKDGSMAQQPAGQSAGFQALFASQQQSAETLSPQANTPFTPQQVLTSSDIEVTDLPHLIEHLGRRGAQPPEVVITPVPGDQLLQDDAAKQPDLQVLAAALERIATSQALASEQSVARTEAAPTANANATTASIQQGASTQGAAVPQSLALAQAQPLIQAAQAQPLIAPANAEPLTATHQNVQTGLTPLANQPQVQQSLAALLKEGMQAQPDSTARLSTEAARAQAMQPQVVAQNAAGQQPLPVFANASSQQLETAPSAAAQWLQELQMANNSQGQQAQVGSGMSVQPSAQDQLSLQGMSTTAAQPTAASSPTLSAPLASTGWNQQLGQQVLNMHMTQDQTVKLRLHPAELGPLMISMKMEEQAATMQFSSNNSQVRAAVEQAIPQLREILAEQGIALGEAGVNDGKKEHEMRDFAELSSKSADTMIEDNSVEPEAIDIPLRNGQIDLYA